MVYSVYFLFMAYQFIVQVFVFNYISSIKCNDTHSYMGMTSLLAQVSMFCKCCKALVRKDICMTNGAAARTRLEQAIDRGSGQLVKNQHTTLSISKHTFVTARCAWVFFSLSLSFS